MKKLLTPSLVLNVIMLLIVLAYMVFDKPCKPCENVSDTITIVHYRTDTIRITKVVYKPVPVTQYDSFPYPVYIDSTETVKDYFKVRKYDIPLRHDSTATLSLLADVWRNSLQRAELRGNIYQKETIIEHTTTVQEKKRFKAFIGIVPGISMADTGIMLSGVVAFQDKRERQYLIKYEPFRKQYEIGLLWKLRFRRE